MFIRLIESSRGVSPVVVYRSRPLPSSVRSQFRNKATVITCVCFNTVIEFDGTTKSKIYIRIISCNIDAIIAIHIDIFYFPICLNKISRSFQNPLTYPGSVKFYYESRTHNGISSLEFRPLTSTYCEVVCIPGFSDNVCVP